MSYNSCCGNCNLINIPSNSQVIKVAQNYNIIINKENNKALLNCSIDAKNYLISSKLFTLKNTLPLILLNGTGP